MNKSTVLKKIQSLDENPILKLEIWKDETHFVKRQVGFCAQWALDNLCKLNTKFLLHYFNIINFTVDINKIILFILLILIFTSYFTINSFEKELHTSIHIVCLELAYSRKQIFLNVNINNLSESGGFQLILICLATLRTVQTFQTSIQRWFLPLFLKICSLKSIVNFFLHNTNA